MSYLDLHKSLVLSVMDDFFPWLFGEVFHCSYLYHIMKIGLGFV